MLKFEYRYATTLSIAIGIALLAASGSAAAAGQTYQDERSACQLRPEAERASCLREAAAAREAARKGQLNGAAAYEANRTQRCNALPVADRDACVRRARGEGTVSGSVEAGGVVREYRELIHPPVPQQPIVAPPQQEQAGTASSGVAGSIAQPPLVAPPAQPVPAPAGVMLERTR
jgi:hypothetical protein